MNSFIPSIYNCLQPAVRCFADFLHVPTKRLQNVYNVQYLHAVGHFKHEKHRSQNWEAF